MRLGRKLLLLVASASLATLLLGGPQAAAREHPHPPGHPHGHPHGHPPGHPHEDPHPTGSCWDITKTATDAHGAPISSITLSLGGTVTINYEIVVTERECGPHETPHESVDVEDSFAGTLANDLDHSQTFHYTRHVTAHTCHPFVVHNAAEVWNDTVLDSAIVTIHVNVHCEHVGGCTLTQGYWKTHSAFGPAPYDNTWASLPGGQGASTTFFLSGQTWFQVFRTAPAGNAYYNLARQYMAARLNILNGASAPASVTNAIATATTLFNTYTPAQIGALKGKNSLRQQFISLAGTLASYNEGAIGPGHCD
jgi:hypothetical protein